MVTLKLVSFCLMCCISIYVCHVSVNYCMYYFKAKYKDVKSGIMFLTM